MTYYHKIVKTLKQSDGKLTAKEIHENVGGHQNKIYQLLKRMRQKDKVIADRNLSQNGVFMYELRQDHS